MLVRYLAPAFPALLLLLAAACADEESTPGATGTSEPGETIDIELTIEDFSFDPDTIEIDFGDDLFIELANDGETTHTFTLNEFLVDEELRSGEDMDLTFTPNEPGEFTFFCRIHPDLMVGSLRVNGGGATPAEAETDEGGGAGIGY